MGSKQIYPKCGNLGAYSQESVKGLKTDLFGV